MNTLKIGVVGLTVGNEHIKSYMNAPYDIEIFICDIDKDRLNTIGTQHQIPVENRFCDFDEMLSSVKLDAVSICVPNFLHKSFTIKALEAGAHVLCEKPMSVNATDALLMKEAADRTGKKLMINYNQRFTKNCRIAQKLISEGVLGDIYFVRTVWHRRRGVPWWYPLSEADKTCGGGPLIDLGCHVLDRALWMCGFPKPKWILANTFCAVVGEEAKQRGIDNFSVEDMGVAMLAMENGMMLELEASWASNRESELVKTRIYGTKGGLVIASDYASDNRSINSLFIEKDGILEDVSFSDFEDEDTGDIRISFIESILNDTQPVCTAEQGLTVMRILDKIYLSAKQKIPVEY